MATDIHIHALPRRLADITMIYPEGVLLYDQPSSTIYIGDGRTAGGIPLGEKAYRLWLVDNPNGTVEEYLASLKGADGKNFTVDATGVLADLINYNAEPKGFTYLTTDTGVMYIKEDDLSGAWSAGIPFRGPEGPAGADGADGASITSAAFVGDDLVFTKDDTTTVTLTDAAITLKGADGAEGAKGDKGDKGEDGDMLIQNYAPTTATIELNPDINIYTITINSATTFVFDVTALNLVAGQACTFELDLTMSTVSTLTFPASVNWVYGAPYMGDAGKIYRLVFHSMNQGASWHANLAFERSIA